MLLPKCVLGLFERAHKMWLSAIANQLLSRALGSLPRLRDVEQDLLDLAVMGLVQPISLLCNTSTTVRRGSDAADMHAGKWAKNARPSPGALSGACRVAGLGRVD